MTSKIKSDIVGLFALLVLVFGSWWVAGKAVELGVLPVAFGYLIISALSIFAWHSDRGPSNVSEWLWCSAGVLILWMAFVSADAWLGHQSHPQLPLSDAVKTVGGMFGFVMTNVYGLMALFVSLAGALRSLHLEWMQR